MEITHGIETANGLIVTLTPEEQAWAEEIGCLRHQRSRERGLGDVAGLDMEDSEKLPLDILGAGAELAVAKALGVEWSATVDADKGAPDVTCPWGEPWQVRHSSHPNARLIGRPRDPRRHYYVLVTGGPSAYIVRGYTLGEVLFSDCNRCTPDPTRPECYAMPQSSLRPLGWYTSLMKQVEGARN